MVFVHYFTETWGGGTRSIWNNRNLVMKMRVPREIFPVASMVAAMYHTGPQLLILVVTCVHHRLALLGLGGVRRRCSGWRS